MKPIFTPFLLVCILFLQTSFSLEAQTYEGSVISPKGAWCWFADSRAMHHRAEGINTSYIGYIDVHGNIKATQHDFNSGKTNEVLIRSYFQPDDHNNPTFLILPDQRVMIFYSRHTDEACFYYRISRKPGDITTLGPEIRLNTPNNTTYPSPFILSDDPNHIYLAWRGINWHPTIARLTMPDENDLVQFNWGPFQIVQSTAARPYAKYDSNGKDKIYLAYTTGHPDNEATNWVYFNYIDINTKQLKDVRGKVLGTVGSGVHNINTTSAYRTANPDAVVEDSSFRNWIWQTTTDADGNPVIAIVRINGNKTVHDYYYAKWTGTSWRRTFIANGGGHFHQTPGLELCYSAGMAIDDSDPSIVYCAVPVAGNYGTVYEIWKYVMAENGTVASSEAITRNSRLNNSRPYVITNSGDSPMKLTWMNGNYYDWIVSSSRPLGYPTAIHAHFDGLSSQTDLNSQLQTLEEFDGDVNGTATTNLGVLVSTPNTYAAIAAPTAPSFSVSLTPYIFHGAYHGKILEMGNLTYGLDASNQKPYVTIGSTTYRSSNLLGTSDVWRTQSRSTGGQWYTPTKLEYFNLTITYENNLLTIYRNGLIDQRFETEAFVPGEIRIGGFAGWVEDCRVYNRAINQQEVEKLTEISLAYTFNNALVADIELETLYVPEFVYSDLVLRGTTSSGVNVSWSSSAPAVLAATGLVTFPTQPVDVTLTATISGKSKAFQTTVMPRNIFKNRIVLYTFEAEDVYTDGAQRYIKDKSGNNFDARIMGNAQVNGTLNLTNNTAGGFSTNGYAIAPSGILGRLKSATFLMRIRPASLTTQPRLFDFGSASANSIFLRANGFTAGYKYNNGATTLINSSTQLTNNQDAWVAMSYDSRTRTTRIFLNGNQTASSTTITRDPWQLLEIGPDNRNYIGRTQWWDTGVANDNVDYRGIIDDFMVFDIALTASEMDEMLNNITSASSAEYSSTMVFPNPTRRGDKIQLQSELPVLEAHIINTLGQSIATYRNSPSYISIANTEQPGIYFLKLRNSHGTETVKLMVE